MNSRPPPDLLPQELLWAEGGHASDIVLTALADGQHAIVPTTVRQHVDRCTLCTTQLGHAALLSLHAGAELEARARHSRAVSRATEPRKLPRLAIALGLVFAALGLVPSLVDDSASLRSFGRDLPVFVHGLGALARRLDEPGSSAGLFLTYAAAITLVAMGILLARLLPKKETSR
jgi:hypothetical protein